MHNFHIGIDIDGTVTEPYYWLERVNQYFKTNIQPEDVTVYEIHKILGIEPEEYEKFYQLFGKLLHKEARIRSGAQEVINQLYHNHMIHFITARESIMKNVSVDWLKRYHIPMDSITLLGSSDKVDEAQRLSCDIFIEDRYENALQLSKAGIDVLLLDCSYNQGALPVNVTRVKNWFAIAMQIENLIRIFEVAL